MSDKFPTVPPNIDEDETVTITKKQYDSLESSKKALKANIMGQLEKEAVHITAKQKYEMYDDKEIDLVLMKKDPNTYDYSSQDLWNLGKYRLESLFNSHETIIFNHIDPKKNTKTVFFVVKTSAIIKHRENEEAHFYATLIKKETFQR